MQPSDFAGKPTSSTSLQPSAFSIQHIASSTPSLLPVHDHDEIPLTRPVRLETRRPSLVRRSLGRVGEPATIRCGPGYRTRRRRATFPRLAAWRAAPSASAAAKVEKPPAPARIERRSPFECRVRLRARPPECPRGSAPARALRPSSRTSTSRRHCRGRHRASAVAAQQAATAIRRDAR